MRIIHVAGGLMMALALAGCQRTSMSGVDTQPVTPLQAAPVGTVQSGQLPDPTTSTSQQFPAAPTTDTAMAMPGAAAPGAAAGRSDVHRPARPRSPPPCPGLRPW